MTIDIFYAFRYGFDVTDTSVIMNQVVCGMESITSDTLVYITPPGSGADYAWVSIGNFSLWFDPIDYTYDSSTTPTVTSISPSTANPGDTVTISGSYHLKIQSL